MALHRTACILLISAACGSKAHPAPALTHAIDHVGIAAPDLDAAIALVAKRTGVTPIQGGSHPGQGTHNALMSLGNGTYLELIAPMPGAKLSGADADLAKLTAPTPMFFAVHSSDIAATRALLRDRGFRPTELQPGSRERPDGVTLHWQTFGVTGPGLDAAPFFIEWGRDTPHPSTTSPTGCRLLHLELIDRDVSADARLLQTLGLDVSVRSGESAGLRVTLRCPNGDVTFGP